MNLEPPASVAINDNLSTYATSFGVGMAQSVLAVAIALIQFTAGETDHAELHESGSASPRILCPRWIS